MPDARVSERVRLRRVLVGLDHQPPGISPGCELLQDGIEIYGAVAGSREYFAEDRVKADRRDRVARNCERVR